MKLDISGTPLPDNLSKYFSLQGSLHHSFIAPILCYLIANLMEEYAVSSKSSQLWKESAKKPRSEQAGRPDQGAKIETNLLHMNDPQVLIL